MATESSLQFLWKLFLALMVAVPIGLEREKARKFAGVRTSLLITAVGFFSSFFAGTLGASWLVGVGLAFATVIAVIMYYARARRERHPGLTTSIVFVLLFCFGVLVDLGMYFEAIASSIVVTFLLSAKEFTKSVVKKLEEKELVEALVLGFVSFIFLPLMPNRTVDPWGLFNPFLFWTMAVFVMGVGFAGYVATKTFGSEMGVGLTGIIGGLVSSLAVVFSMAPQAGRDRAHSQGAALAVTLASATMLLRVLALSFIGSRALFNELVLPLLVAAALGMILSLRSPLSLTKRISFDLSGSSPLAFRSALEFALLFLALTVSSRFLVSRFGSVGLYVAAALAGVAGLNALIVSSASLVSVGAIPTEIAAVSVLVGCFCACAANVAFSARLGGRRFALGVGKALAVMAVVCAASVALFYLRFQW